MITATIPYPPTANHLFANVAGKGRVKSAAYKAWIDSAGYVLNLACVGKRIDGPYALTLRVGKPDNRKRDLSNLLKASEDLLVACRAVRDDSDCQRIDLSWTTEHPDVFVMVMPCRAVEPVPAPASRQTRRRAA